MSPSKLRSLSEINNPDNRSAYFAVSLEVFHKRICDLTLFSEVPSEIIAQFEVAKNLLLYSWFVYEFGPVSEMHAYSTAEYALKKRFGDVTIKENKLCGFSKLLNYAIDNGILKDGGITQAQRIIERERNGYLQWKEIMDSIGEEVDISEPRYDPQGFIKLMAKYMPKARNKIAHGSSYLSPPGYITLEICRDIINQLYKA